MTYKGWDPNIDDLELEKRKTASEHTQQLKTNCEGLNYIILYTTSFSFFKYKKEFIEMK